MVARADGHVEARAPMITMPPIDDEKNRLASRVVCLSCCSFLLTVIFHLISSAVIIGLVSQFPNTYEDFSEECKNGDLPPSACVQIQNELDKWCLQQDPPLEEYECEQQWDANADNLKTIVIGGLLLSIVPAICCAACVPVCGCIGAKKDSRGFIILFMIMNGLSAFMCLLGIANGDYLRIMLLILPAASFYYGWKLQYRQANSAALLVAPPLFDPAPRYSQPKQPSAPPPQ